MSTNLWTIQITCADKNSFMASVKIISYAFNKVSDIKQLYKIYKHVLCKKSLSEDNIDNTDDTKFN